MASYDQLTPEDRAGLEREVAAFRQEMERRAAEVLAAKAAAERREAADQRRRAMGDGPYSATDPFLMPDIGPVQRSEPRKPSRDRTPGDDVIDAIRGKAVRPPEAEGPVESLRKRVSKLEEKAAVDAGMFDEKVRRAWERAAEAKRALQQLNENRAEAQARFERCVAVDCRPRPWRWPEWASPVVGWLVTVGPVAAISAGGPPDGSVRFGLLMGAAMGFLGVVYGCLIDRAIREAAGDGEAVLPQGHCPVCRKVVMEGECWWTSDPLKDPGATPLHPNGCLSQWSRETGDRGLAFAAGPRFIGRRPKPTDPS